PFDQLPDNYVQGNTLLDAILEIEPGMKGEKVDRYGADPTGEFRYGITSYKYYRYVEDLKPIVDCAAQAADPAVYYACFNATKANEEDDAAGSELPVGATSAGKAEKGAPPASGTQQK